MHGKKSIITMRITNRILLDFVFGFHELMFRCFCWQQVSNMGEWNKCKKLPGGLKSWFGGLPPIGFGVVSLFIRSNSIDLYAK